MFDSSLRPAGSEHTVTVALLAAAFIFIPALVAVSQPLSYSPAIGASALCVVVAWSHWKRSRRVSIPAIATKGKAAK